MQYSEYCEDVSKMQKYLNVAGGICCKFAKVSVISYVHMLQNTRACSSTDKRTMILLSLRSGLDATKRRTDWRGNRHTDKEQLPKNRANRQSRNTHTQTQHLWHAKIFPS